MLKDALAGELASNVRRVANGERVVDIGLALGSPQTDRGHARGIVAARGRMVSVTTTPATQTGLSCNV